MTETDSGRFKKLRSALARARYSQDEFDRSRRSVISLNRVVLVVLAVCAGIWIWAKTLERREAAANRAFHAQRVTPFLDGVRRQNSSISEALNDRRRGIATPLPPFEPHSPDVLGEWLTRMEKQHRYSNIRTSAELASVVALLVWFIGLQVRVQIRRHQWESGSRSPMPGAGSLIASLMNERKQFTAGRGNGSAEPEVLIDGESAVVVFRQLTFITGFVGNRVSPVTTVPFADLLTGYVYRGRGGPLLHLRTTKGKVTIDSGIQPFEALVHLLLDIAELNRMSHGSYLAARAREPFIRTPWYGWLIFVVMIAGIALLSWWQLTQR